MLQVSLLTENGNTKDDLRLPTDDSLLTQASDLVFSLSDMLEQVFLFVWCLNLSVPLLYLLQMQTKSTPCWNCVMIFLITMIWWCIANFISSRITSGYYYVFLVGALSGRSPQIWPFHVFPNMFPICSFATGGCGNLKLLFDFSNNLKISFTWQLLGNL